MLTLHSFFYIFLSFAILTYVFNLFFIIASTIVLWRENLRTENGDHRQYLNIIANSQFAPGVSIIVPAFNEEKVINETVAHLLQLNYSKYEIIVVNDGSDDRTLEVLTDDKLRLVPLDRVLERQVACEKILKIYNSYLYPFLFVIDKENGGKADAINAGLNLTQYPFVCCIDADTLIERNSLAILMTRLLSNNEEIACAGSIRPLNGLVLDKERNVYSLFLPGSFIQKIQTIEYIRSFTLARSGLNLLNGNLIISGAFGVFDRKTLIEIGGYQQLSKGEDIEIVVKIQKRMREQKRAFRIAYHPDAVAWTYLPDNLADLQKQRIRWHLGLLSTIITLNKNVFLNPRYGTMGLVVFPYYIFVEIISPFLEPAGFIYTLILIALGLLKWHFLLLFWGAPVIACWITSLIALLIDHYFLHYYSIRQYGLLSIYGLMEGLWYHYLTVWWRLQATYIWLFGKPSRRTGWQSPRRNK